MVDRSALLAAKLNALVTDRWGPDASRLAASVPGAVILADADTMWALVDDQSVGVGPSLAWAAKHDRRLTHLLADDTTVLVRQMRALKEPPRTWQVQGRSLIDAPPSPPIPRGEIAEAVVERALALTDVGLDVLFEHGLALGEHRGLEVARVVPDGSGARLEIGIGQADREVQELMAAQHPELDRLRGVAALARKYRTPEAGLHPLSRMARERWLRSDLLADPSKIGLVHLEPVEPVVARPNMVDPAPAFAVGERADGSGVVVACSVGIDLGLVPRSADVWLREAEGPDGPDTTMILVMPERDRHRITVLLADGLSGPTEVLAVEGSWSG